MLVLVSDNKSTMPLIVFKFSRVHCHIPGIQLLLFSWIILVLGEEFLMSSLINYSWSVLQPLVFLMKCLKVGVNILHFWEEKVLFCCSSFDSLVSKMHSTLKIGAYFSQRLFITLKCYQKLCICLHSDRLQNGTSDEEVVLPEFVVNIF